LAGNTQPQPRIVMQRCEETERIETAKEKPTGGNVGVRRETAGTVERNSKEERSETPREAEDQRPARELPSAILREIA
jgi:hypothetical protein